MRALPVSWVKTTVGELFQTVGGGTPPTGVPEFWNGTIPWISSADIAADHCLSITRFISEEAVKASATNIVPAGSVIVVTRVGLGKVAIADVPLCFSQDHQALIIPDHLLDRRYVLHYMSTAVQTYKHIGRGTTVSGITKRQLLDTGFILPPRPEQSRIVAEIEKQFSRLDAATAALKRVQANLKRYRASVLKAACEGRLVPTEAELARKEGRDYEPADQLLQRILRERRTRWEADTLAKMIAFGKPPKDDRWMAKYAEPPIPDVSMLPTPPEGWVWATLPQLGDVARGKSKHRPRNDPRLFGGAYPFIQTGDVKRSNGLITGYTQTYNDYGLEQSRLWPEGTLCITIAANIAESGILGYPACFPDSIVGFVPVKLNRYLVRWIHLFLETTKDQIARFAPATAQKNINLETLSNLTVPLPPWIELQRVVDEADRRLSTLDLLESQILRQATRAGRLRRAVLSHAFRGRLTPQYPHDESARDLLLRIRAERASGRRRESSRRRTEHANV